jgi:hypothetical protein
MTIEIKHRYSGAVLFKSEETTIKDAVIDARNNGADLSRADLSRADLRGAYLFGANLRGADLGGADLGGADLGGADLSRAYLGGADLGGADLGGADLSRAHLGGADLGDQWIIQGATRSDGWPFFLQQLTGDKEPQVKAGCRFLTIAEAQAHWTKTRAGTALLAETENIVRSMIELARIRKLIV